MQFYKKLDTGLKILLDNIQNEARAKKAGDEGLIAELSQSTQTAIGALLDGYKATPPWFLNKVTESFFKLCEYAIRKSSLTTIQAFVDRGLPFGGQDKQGNTPLMQAVQCGELEIVKLLLTDEAIALMHYPGKHESLQWKWQHRERQNPSLQDHLEAKDKDLSTPLLHAMDIRDEDRSVQIARLLIEKGANVDYAPGSNRTCLLAAIASGNEQFANLLIDSKANLKLTDGNRNSPLHYAIGQGQKDIMVRLIEHGANIHAKDNDGKTPRQLAAANGKSPSFVTELEAAFDQAVAMREKHLEEEKRARELPRPASSPSDGRIANLPRPSQQNDSLILTLDIAAQHSRQNLAGTLRTDLNGSRAETLESPTQKLRL